jgi:oxygen-independent coproporphyrinogen-3 oxidase
MYKNYEAKTIYFGGGTPSAVDPEYIDRIISSSNPFSESEITLELNPEHYKEYKHVNRLSIGIQSFNDNILKKIGRQHSSKDAVDVYYRAREKIKNISLDLMFALPGETKDILKFNLEQIKLLDPDHISIYSLIWKENTYFDHLYKRGLLKKMSEDLEADFYEYIIAYLEDLGYIHYEISSFCKPGKESKHNIAYWKNREYLGFGLGAAGHYRDVRYKNFSRFDQYYDSIDQKCKPINSEEHLNVDIKEEYKIILGLRLLKEGLLSQEIKIKKNIDILKKFVDEELLLYSNDRYMLTKKGLFLSNELFMEFID